MAVDLGKVDVADGLAGAEVARQLALAALDAPRAGLADFVGGIAQCDAVADL
ncbi:MAG: hypothetical protein AAF602_26990 [Myxococcota bacterium]